MIKVHRDLLFERLKSRNVARAVEKAATEKAAKESGNPPPVPNTHGEPSPTDRLFPKYLRELFKTILKEEALRFDRDGRPPHRLQLTAHLYLPSPHRRHRHLPDR